MSPSVSYTPLPPLPWRSVSSRPLPADPSIVVLCPPYDPERVFLASGDLRSAAEVPGTIVGVRLSRPEVEREGLRALIRGLSQRAPSCPVVILLAMPPEAALLIAARLAPLRARAVVPTGESMQSVLREALTDPTTLPDGVVDWLRMRSIRLSPNLAYLLERIFALGPEHADIGSLLESLRMPQATARFRLRKRRLPPPGQWFQLARALHAALLLQAEPERSTASVAARLGFADHSALAHLLRRTCRAQAREVRHTLGWEWLLDRWIAARQDPRK